MYYILENGKIKQVEFQEMASWMEGDPEARQVDFTKIEDVEISTVFLFIDHNHRGEGPPILFETMVFGGVFNESQRRYRTLGEAKAGHWEIVEVVREKLKNG